MSSDPTCSPQGNQNARELPENTCDECDNDTESPGLHLPHQSPQLQPFSYFELLWRLVVVLTLSSNQITINPMLFPNKVPRQNPSVAVIHMKWWFSAQTSLWSFSINQTSRIYAWTLVLRRSSAMGTLDTVGTSQLLAAVEWCNGSPCACRPELVSNQQDTFTPTDRSDLIAALPIITL
jgi:hypothetical protein